MIIISNLCIKKIYKKVKNASKSRKSELTGSCSHIIILCIVLNAQSFCEFNRWLVFYGYRTGTFRDAHNTTLVHISNKDGKLSSG